ncbi:TatD family hydrolase [Flavobacterium pallidum]|uniref:Hydrolase TatD n=1 Tax=Flavobacterium pallidum TaxID=2172098 RepID=A0A2S1SJ39_9FLAO|nr:TatD family hydrolase [Flavobacterium pallidum]AWI26359.1 hydrolase TatD [Flavobacterium pallidum]
MMFFNLHTHHFTDSGVVELVNQYPDEFDENIPLYSIGIHPWRIEAADVVTQLHFIETKLTDSHCLAIGECGLDKRIETPLEKQIPVFEAQLLLAEKYKKPVIIHCVAAFQEVIELKNKLGISIPMIIHGFSKNIQVARSLLDNGFYISFGKYLLRNPELAAVFAAVPNDRFFLETDTIEEGIEQVYAVAAKAKGIETETLQEILNKSFIEVFQQTRNS